MSDFGTYSPEEKRKIKRRRAIRLVISLILGLAAAFLLYTEALTTREMLALPTWRLAAILILFGASVAIGWNPNWETMFGDQEVYVEEPEIEESSNQRKESADREGDA